jgi:hypothetical protein
MSPLGADVPTDFLEEFGAWMRIEPRSRRNDLEGGLQARTADPLWMLGRQWQTGEFDAQNRGSIVSASLQYSTQPFETLRLGIAGETLSVPDMPLEMLVERENVPLDWRTRAQIGQQFERYIRTAGTSAPEDAIASLRNALPFPPDSQAESDELDESTKRFLRFMTGRVIDGGVLLDRIADGELDTPTGMTDSELDTVVGRLATWYASVIARPAAGASAWQNRQLQYRFEVNPNESSDSESAGTERTNLVAPNYRNGALDWYSFSIAGDPRGEWDEESVSAVPTPIRIGGTSPRWWAFEDAATDFGDVDVATTDLAVLLLLEFVLVYGDDWFSVPVAVDMPRITRIDGLTLHTVFGEDIPVDPVRDVVRRNVLQAGGDPDDPLLRWEMFNLASYPSSNPDAPSVGAITVVPPVAGFRDESKPIEEIQLARDEGANLVFAIEHIVTNGLGRPVRGFDAQRERAGNAASAPDTPRSGTDGVPPYRLATPVADNWVPFLPASASPFLGTSRPNIQLRRGVLLRNSAAEFPAPIPAMTTLLSGSVSDSLKWLEESAVTRAGVRLQLTAQRARWTDGKTYVWLGRKVLTGAGEASSGLKFDNSSAPTVQNSDVP